MFEIKIKTKTVERTTWKSCSSKSNLEGYGYLSKKVSSYVIRVHVQPFIYFNNEPFWAAFWLILFSSFFSFKFADIVINCCCDIVIASLLLCIFDLGRYFSKILGPAELPAPVFRKKYLLVIGSFWPVSFINSIFNLFIVSIH